MRAETQSAPPKIAAPQSLAFFMVVVLVVAALGSGAVLFFFDPAEHSFYPICLFHSLTKLNCPGCGATRAVYALVHGNAATALRDNALFTLALAGLMIRAAWMVLSKSSGGMVREFFPTKFLWPLLVVALVFTVLRNLPAFAFLAP